MEEIEIIDKLMKANGLEKEKTFGDYVEMYKRLNRAIKYYWEQKEGKTDDKEEEGGNKDA